jgi:hypothetical protein
MILKNQYDLLNKEKEMDPRRLHRKGFTNDVVQDIFNTLEKEIENEKLTYEKVSKEEILKYLRMFIEWHETVSSLKDTPYKITPLYLIGDGNKTAPEYFLEELVHLYNQWIFAVYAKRGISVKFNHFGSHDCSFTPVESMPYFSICDCGTDDFFIAGSSKNYPGNFGTNTCAIKFEVRIIGYHINKYLEKRHNQLFIDLNDEVKEVDETNCHFVGRFTMTFSHIVDEGRTPNCNHPDNE